MAAGISSRREYEPLIQRWLGALVVSVLAHLSFFGVARLGSQLQWWDSKAFEMFHSVKMTPEEIAKIEAEARKREEERQLQQPTMFIQVTEPSDEPPPQAKYYSSVSSRAANPDPGDAAQAKIDGRQEQVARVAEAPQVMTGRPTAPSRPEDPGTADPSPQAASAVVPKPEPVRPPTEIPKLVERQPEPQRQAGIGDLAMVRPEPRVMEPPPPKQPPKPVEETPQATPAPVQPSEARSRPRTVTEAKLRQSLLAGEKMKQDGGVSRKGPVQVDAVGMPFGAYDEAMVAAVQNRWYTLLDERRFAGGARGHVVIRFKLHSDGSVTHCEAIETSVDSLFSQLCVRAVSDPSPYEKWPSDMLRMIGSPVREMRFTFYYN